MGGHRKVLVVAAVLVLVAGAAVAGGAAPPGPGRLSSGCAGNRPVRPVVAPTLSYENQIALGDRAVHIEEVGLDRFPDVFLSSGIDAGANIVLVHRVPSAAFDAWLADDQSGSCIELLPAVHSRRTLEALRDDITGGLGSWWTAVGITQINLSIRPPGVLWVFVEQVDVARRELTARYGSGAPIIVDYRARTT